MEEVLLRFPHIGKQMFEELDNGSLIKCQEVNESWRGFIDGEKIVPFRIIKSLTNVPDTYLKKNFGKADLDSVTELVKNTQNVYSEVHCEQLKFSVRSERRFDRVLYIEREKDGKKLNTIRNMIIGELFLTPICNPTPVPIKLDENLLANLSTGKFFLNYEDNVSESHPRNLSNGYGETILHIAAKNGYLDVCKLIAENIEDKNPQDYRGRTPLQMAEDNDQSSVVEYFKSLTRKSCPYCPAIRLSRLMQNHIRQEHPEKFSIKRKGEINPSLQKTNRRIQNLKESPSSIQHEERNIGKVFVDILDIFTATLARLRIGVKSANVLYIGCKDLWEYLGILGTLPSNANYNLHVLELDTWLTLLKNMDINYELTDKEVREMNIDFYNATNALKKFRNSNFKDEHYEC